MIQGDPYQMRYASSRMTAGSQELRKKAAHVATIEDAVFRGPGGWSGEAANVFSESVAVLRNDISKVSAALERTGHVFQMLSLKFEQVHQLRQQASQVEQSIWGMSVETPEDRHYVSQLRQRAHELRYAAEMEARAADEQAATAFREIADFQQGLQLLQGQGATNSSTVSLTLAQQHRMHKEQEMLDEREASQQPMKVEDLLALYYIMKRDFMSNASPEDIIEQNLKLDGIQTVEALREAVATQVRINQNNRDLEVFCSQPDNHDDPRCIVYRYNQAGGLDPAAMTGLGLVVTKLMVPAAKQALTALRDKVFSKGESAKVALPGSGSITVGQLDMQLVNDDHVQVQRSSMQEGVGNGITSGSVTTRLKATKLSSEKVQLDWLPDKYTSVEVKGSVKVAGKEVDVSRRVYQIEIDKNYVPKEPSAGGLSNLELMSKGKSPFVVKDGAESKVELHHLIQKEPGGMVELAESTHDIYSRELHGLVEDGNSFRNNPLLEKQYNNFRINYWKLRAIEE